MQCRDDYDLCHQASPAKQNALSKGADVNEYSVSPNRSNFTLGFKTPPASSGGNPDVNEIPVDYFCAYDIH